jgi:hypothetical protein
MRAIPLSCGIVRHVNGAYTTYFNVKRQRTGHLLQGRYKAILVEREEYAEELSRYIHLYPVRARVAQRPEEHAWSSYAAYIGAAPSPCWLARDLILSQFGRDEASAQQRYRQFVEAELGRDVVNPLDRVKGSTVLGSESFVQWVQERFIAGRAKGRDVPAVRALGVRSSLEAIEREAAERVPGDQRIAKRIALYVSHRYSGADHSRRSGPGSGWESRE